MLKNQSKFYFSIIEDNDEDLKSFRKSVNSVDRCILLASAISVDEYLSNNIKKTFPHFLFLDIHLNGQKSISRIPDIVKKYPDLEIIMFTTDENYETLMEAMSLGASGYFLKSSIQNEIRNQLKILIKGGAILSAFMARKMILKIHEKNHLFKIRNKLTEKEIETLKFISQGWTYQAIGRLTGISIDGVRARVKRIYRKLNVNSKIRAIKKFNDMQF